MTRYTVKQLADVARISVRTLHHYDEIGLLEPAYVGDNGYRYYEPPQLYRLQQILLYRELGLSLSEIGGILAADDFEISAALRQHRVRLSQRLEQQQQLLRVIDDTLARLNGDTGMQDSKLYEWHSPEKQAEYEAWLAERYGPQGEEWVATSRKRTDSFTDDDKNAAMDRLATIEKDLVDAYNRGMSAGAQALSPLFDRHRQWVAHMWNRDCPPGCLCGPRRSLFQPPGFRETVRGHGAGILELADGCDESLCRAGRRQPRLSGPRQMAARWAAGVLLEQTTSIALGEAWAAPLLRSAGSGFVPAAGTAAAGRTGNALARLCAAAGVARAIAPNRAAAFRIAGCMVILLTAYKLSLGELMEKLSGLRLRTARR